MEEKPLINQKIVLEKFPGKGGWTYAPLPTITSTQKNPFGWVKVRGSIDDYEIKQYKLMPMGDKRLFLPVKAAIRKKIKKEAGDWVKVVLFLDESELEIPTEIMTCFALESPKLLATFLSFTEGERKAYIDWIYSAKMDDTKVNRILEMMRKLEKGLRLMD